jgi:ubiquinone/menaquinone biosynthesis C-methylase UbiE
MLSSSVSSALKWDRHAATRGYKVTPEKALIIRQFLNGYATILDLGCGDGIYMNFLKLQGEFVVGLDISMSRLKNARKVGNNLVRASLEKLPFKSYIVDAGWRSEVIVNLPSLEILSDIERVAKKVIIVTMPNPSGPFYWADKTHILRYSIRSLSVFLSKRKWNYELHGIGLATGIPIPKPLRELMFKISWRVCYLAFTLLLIGTKGNAPTARQNTMPALSS